MEVCAALPGNIVPKVPNNTTATQFSESQRLEVVISFTTYSAMTGFKHISSHQTGKVGHSKQSIYPVQRSNKSFEYK